MNLKRGHIGIQEGVSAAAISMTTSALFTLDFADCYRNGNSTYVTFPAAALISLALFLTAVSAVKKSGAEDLAEFLTLAFGRAGAAFWGFILSVCLVWAAFLPLSRFVQAMHGVFYEGVSYVKLTMFILPSALILCLLGFETIGRTAKCFSVLLLLMFAATVLSASGGFETYRLYPLLGNGLRENTVSAFTQTFAFLPALLTLIILSGGLNGIDAAKKTGLIASFAAAAVCFTAQLTLGMIYTYTELSMLFIPLYRLNHLSILENSLMRLDKLSHMVWLNGSIIAGAFYIYGASFLFCRLFSMKDVRPAVSTNVILTVILILMKFSGSFYKMLPLLNIMNDYGFLIITGILLAAMVFALLKSRRKTPEGLKML